MGGNIPWEGASWGTHPRGPSFPSTPLPRCPRQQHPETRSSAPNTHGVDRWVGGEGDARCRQHPPPASPSPPRPVPSKRRGVTRVDPCPKPGLLTLDPCRIRGRLQPPASARQDEERSRGRGWLAAQLPQHCPAPGVPRWDDSMRRKHYR